MNKILLLLIIFILLISAGIYFYNDSSLLTGVMPSGAPFTKKQASTKEKEQKEKSLPIKEGNNLYKDEKVVIKKGIKNIDVVDQFGLKYPRLYASPNGNTVVSVIRKDDKEQVLVNDEEWGEYSMVGIPIFSFDGKTIAYEARQGDTKMFVGGKGFVVVNGKKGKNYDFIEDLIISLDGRTIAYIANEGGDEAALEKIPATFTVINGKEGKKYDGINNLTFNLDGTVAYVARECPDVCDVGDDKFFTVVNDKEGKKYDDLYDLKFSPDGRLGYIAERNYKRFVVINSEEGQGYDNVKDLVFSSDGNSVAYAAKDNNNKWFKVVNNKEGKKYDDVYSLIFSPDSKTLTYIASEGYGSHSGSSFIVTDGTEGKKYNKANTRIGGVKFSPDSQTISYVVAEIIKDKTLPGKSFVIIDNQEGKQYDWVSAVSFSPDSQGFAYIAMQSKELFIVVNNKEQEKYLNTSEPVFLNNNTIRYFAYDGENIYRITKVIK